MFTTIKLKMIINILFPKFDTLHNLIMFLMQTLFCKYLFRVYLPNKIQNATKLKLNKLQLKEFDTRPQRGVEANQKITGATKQKMSIIFFCFVLYNYCSTVGGCLVISWQLDGSLAPLIWNETQSRLPSINVDRK